MKTFYEQPEVLIENFEIEDIITTSGGEENESPFIPG